MMRGQGKRQRVILETMRLCGGIWPPHLRIDRHQKVILETLHRHGIVTRVPHSAGKCVYRLAEDR
jgi:hypothetical protein